MASGVALFRQLRGHVLLAFTPTTSALLAVGSVIVAVRARTDRGVLVQDGVRHVAEVAPLGALRVALLQTATLSGLILAVVVAATVAGAFGGDAREQVAAVLEPSATSRWIARFGAVLVSLGCAVVAATLVVVTAALATAWHGGSAVEISGAGAGAAHVLAHALLVLAAFASVAVLLGTLLSGDPAIAAGVTVGGAVALLLLQHLMGDVGDVVVPTAWPGRWMELSSRDFGVAYYWTAGRYASGQAEAGSATLLVFAVSGLAGRALLGHRSRA
jgi:hypothetical protein